MEKPETNDEFAKNTERIAKYVSPNDLPPVLFLVGERDNLVAEREREKARSNCEEMKNDLLKLIGIVDGLLDNMADRNALDDGEDGFLEEYKAKYLHSGN